jgi:RNA polymerase sigma-70 factor (ECF subfamily)
LLCFWNVRYAELAGQIGMSVGAMRMSVRRMRRRYRRLLREEITETVARPDDIDDEIRFLVSTLSA